MGKYNDLFRNHQRAMARYSYVMDDTARAWNDSHAQLLERMAEQKTAEELENRITDNVLANLSKSGSKAAQDIANQIQTALNSIKL